MVRLFPCVRHKRNYRLLIKVNNSSTRCSSLVIWSFIELPELGLSSLKKLLITHRRASNKEWKSDRTHLLPDGYEFCDNDKAELFLQVSAIQEIQNQDIGTLVQSLPNSPYDALYKGVRKIQYNISIHERFALWTSGLITPNTSSVPTYSPATTWNDWRCGSARTDLTKTCKRLSNFGRTESVGQMIVFLRWLCYETERIHQSILLARYNDTGTGSGVQLAWILCWKNCKVWEVNDTYGTKSSRWNPNAPAPLQTWQSGQAELHRCGDKQSTECVDAL